MAFDASVIGDISSGANADLSGAQGKALTLADLYNTNTQQKAKIAADRQQQSDMTYAKQILAGKDLSKLEDQNAAVAQITKRSPQLGMELMRGFQGQQAGKTQLQNAQLELYQAKNEIIGSDLMQLKAKHDQIQAANPKATEQQIHDAMQKDVIDWVTRMSQQTLPDGSPLLNDQDKATIKAGLGQGYSVEWVNSMVARSQQAKAAIAQQLAERKQNLAEKKEGFDETHKTTLEEQSARKIRDQEALASAKIKLASEGKFTDEDAQALAGQYLAGDKSVMTGLGRGAQGAQNIIMVRHAIAQQAKEQGMKPADIAARLAEYTGFVSEQRSLGTQQANVEMASSEAQQMIANARQASAAVPRSAFLPWSKLSQMTDKQLNDAGLASLKAATTAVINTWARAINPKGVATVADKEHGYELLNAAQSQEAFNAVLDRFDQETTASLAAPASAKQRLHDAFLSGQTPTVAAPPSPQSPQPAPGRGAPAPGAPAAMPGAAAPARVVHWDDLP